jgi:hypothetical protein
MAAEHKKNDVRIISVASVSSLPLSTLSWPIPSLSSDRRVPRVVIIGAGTSGLACAHSLIFGAADAPPVNTSSAEAANRPEVIVLEGRDRLGGRIHSMKMNDEKGTIVDFGMPLYCLIRISFPSSLSSGCISIEVIIIVMMEW